jgi:hypothetical protein
VRYVKLYESIKTGTLAAEGGFAFVLWPLFMMEADWDGVVEVHPGVMAVRWTGSGRCGKIAEEQVRAACTYWEQPDPSSRSPIEEGRRIIRLHEHRDWGWRIVNWVEYRDAEGIEKRRAADRDRKRMVRGKSANSPQPVRKTADNVRTCHTQITEDREQRIGSGSDISSQEPPPEATGGAGSPLVLSGELKPKGPPNCPHEAIVELYHEILPELPRVLEWNPRRRGYLNTAWKAKPKRQCLEYWRLFFKFVRESDLLMGRLPPQKDRGPWKADLEWLVKPANFLKINEKKYHHD